MYKTLAELMELSSKYRVINGYVANTNTRFMLVNGELEICIAGMWQQPRINRSWFNREYHITNCEE